MIAEAIVIVYVTVNLIPDFFQVGCDLEGASPSLGTPVGKQETDPFASPDVIEPARFSRIPSTATMGSCFVRGIDANSRSPLIPADNSFLVTGQKIYRT